MVGTVYSTLRVTFRLPVDLVTWLRGQGNQTAVVVAALEAYKGGGGRLPEANNSLTPERRGGVPAAPHAPQKNRLVRTRMVKVWEDGYEYEREEPA